MLTSVYLHETNVEGDRGVGHRLANGGRRVGDQDGVERCHNGHGQRVPLVSAYSPPYPPQPVHKLCYTWVLRNLPSVRKVGFVASRGSGRG